jgi:hypothetical protein
LVCGTPRIHPQRRGSGQVEDERAVEVGHGGQNMEATGVPPVRLTEPLGVR